MLLEAIIFSLTEVKSQGKYACKLESLLNSKMKRFFCEPAVAWLLTKIALFMPSLPSLTEIQDGCHCCCDFTVFFARCKKLALCLNELRFKALLICSGIK